VHVNETDSQVQI